MRLTERLEFWAKPRVTTVAIVLFVVGSLLWFQVEPMASLGSEGILDDDWGFTTAEAQAHLEGLGDDGRADYARFLWLDLGYALLLLPGGTLGLASVTRKWHKLRPLRPVMFLPAEAVVLDWVENFMMMRVVNQFPTLDADAVAVASIASTIKLIVVTATLALVGAAVFAHFLDGMWRPVRRVPKNSKKA